jgi:hypothetical protein
MSDRENSSGVQQPLFSRTPEEAAFDAAIEAARRSLTPSELACAEPRFKAVLWCDNHQGAVLGRTAKQHHEAFAHQLGISLSRFEHILADYLRTLKEQGPEAAYIGLAVRKPGPEEGSHSRLALWEMDYITNLWEDKKCCLTRAQVYKLFIEHRREKARALGGSYSYGPEPSRSTVARYINTELFGDRNPKRYGAQALKTAAGFIPRHFEDEYAGDAWCLDEWELDCYCYRDDNHRLIYNWGFKNPVLHILTIIDERSTCILDWIVTDNLEDDVLTLAERLLRNSHPAPLRLVTDRAGRFRRLSYGHTQQRNIGELVDRLEGPLGRLGVIPRGSPEKNPRGNRIERAIHGAYASLAHRDFGLSYRPPRKSGLRDVTEIDKRVENHLRFHCGMARNSERAGEPSELKSVSEIINIVNKWIEEINNSPTNANGCHGLTRCAAFNSFRPSENEIASRRPAQSVIDEVFAEHFTRMVPEHSMLSIDGDWYDAIELTYHIGEEVQIIRYRRDPEQVFVECGSEPRIVARRKARVGIHADDRLAAETELLARRRKALAGTADVVAGADAPAQPPAADAMDNAHASLSSQPIADYDRRAPIYPLGKRRRNRRGQGRAAQVFRSHLTSEELAEAAIKHANRPAPPELHPLEPFDPTTEEL